MGECWYKSTVAWCSRYKTGWRTIGSGKYLRSYVAANRSFERDLVQKLSGVKYSVESFEECSITPGCKVVCGCMNELL